MKILKGKIFNGKLLKWISSEILWKNILCKNCHKTPQEKVGNWVDKQGFVSMSREINGNEIVSVIRPKIRRKS